MWHRMAHWNPFSCGWESPSGCWTLSPGMGDDLPSYFPNRWICQALNLYSPGAENGVFKHIFILVIFFWQRHITPVSQLGRVKPQGSSWPASLLGDFPVDSSSNDLAWLWNNEFHELPTKTLRVGRTPCNCICKHVYIHIYKYTHIYIIIHMLYM